MAGLTDRCGSVDEKGAYSRPHIDTTCVRTQARPYTHQCIHSHAPAQASMWSMSAAPGKWRSVAQAQQVLATS